MKQYRKHFTFAFRMMVKTPLITVLSIVVLAISIAQVSMMFNMIDTVLFSKLPYEGGDRLIRVERRNPENQFCDRNMPFESYHRFLEKQDVFEGVIGLFSDNANLQTGLKHSQEFTAYVSTDFLDVLGVQPYMGRAFSPEDAEANADPVLLVSYHVWKDFFGGHQDIVGKTIIADGASRTVIGVLPRDFDFPFTNQLWIPLNTDTLVESVGWGSSLFMIGKLKPEVALEDAEKQMNFLYERICEEYPHDHQGYQFVELLPFKDLFVDQNTRMLFLAMAVCAILVLFMGCAIVSNLTTVRSVKRSNELAIRSALGASRVQIVGQMLFESLILSVISFVLGWLFMNWFTVSVLEKYYLQFNVPSWFFASSYNIKHLFFVVTVLVVVTLMSTLIPALRASRTSINDLLKDSSRTGSSVKLTVLGRLLIVFQIAAACAVVTGAAIVGYYLHDVNNQESDFDKKQYVYAQLGMDANTHRDPKVRIELMKSFERELEQVPGVLGVTFSTEYYVPSLTNALRKIDEDYASPDAFPQLRRRVVAPGYFETMNYSLIAGREFNEFDDTEHPEVIVVTDVLAKQFFGNENPIGKQLIYSDDEDKTVTIIGVVKDLFRSDRDQDGRTGFFRCTYQDVWFDSGLHIHVSGNPMRIEKDLVRLIGDVDSSAVVLNISTIDEREQSFMLGLNFIFVVFMTFATGALIMSAAGLYGVLSFSVNQRIREIGIRLALGASPVSIVMRVFKQGMANVWIGVFVGILMAFALRYLFMSVLTPFFESITVYLGVLLSILFLACCSMLIPAIRGGNTDPAEALRID